MIISEKEQTYKENKLIIEFRTCLHWSFWKKNSLECSRV